MSTQSAKSTHSPQDGGKEGRAVEPSEQPEFTLAPQPGGPKIDPRGPRFGANLTWILLAVVLLFSLLAGPGDVADSLGGRLVEPAWILLAVAIVLFAWGAFAGPRFHPWNVLFRTLVRPRLPAPTEFENPKPPRFAQLVGFIFAFVGILLGAIGVPWGLFVPALFAFIASFLNGVFGYCLGCQLYLLLARARLVRL